MKRSHMAAVALTAAAFALTGGIVNAQSGDGRPTFGTTPDPDSSEQAPQYSAVAGPDGEIAGYVHTDLFESSGPQPSSPEEAAEFSKTFKGNIYEVFDTTGEIVGYFASDPYGFIDETTKDQLVSEGWRFLTAPPPDFDGDAPSLTTKPVEVVPPSTDGDAGADERQG